MADPLDSYRHKRNPDGTPGPFGGGPHTRSGSLTFVVHHHGARRNHYDLRLELDGVLKIWAVPRGPSADVSARRPAAQVEDHPLEYGDFEGAIGAGNYGAGHTIV